MGNELYKSALENKNIKENFEYYENLRKIKQEECLSHIPVIIGYNTTTKIVNNGFSENLKHKKCLLCGKDLSLEPSVFEIEFDASNYKKTSENESYMEMLKRYNNVLDLFTELCSAIDSKEELFEQFNSLINPEYVKTYARSITRQK